MHELRNAMPGITGFDIVVSDLLLSQVAIHITDAVGEDKPETALPLILATRNSHLNSMVHYNMYIL